eukprot:4286011-Pyramimonas_sp.AAC.5
MIERMKGHGIKKMTKCFCESWRHIGFDRTVHRRGNTNHQIDVVEGEVGARRAFLNSEKLVVQLFVQAQLGVCVLGANQENVDSHITLYEVCSEAVLVKYAEPQRGGRMAVVEGTLAAAWTAVTYMMMFSVANRGCGRDGTFCENSCERLQAHVPANLFGQDFAVAQLSDAICDHLAEV